MPSHDIQIAFPSLRGRIDKYGYYTDREPPIRVALSTYFVYSAQSDLFLFLTQLREEDDPSSYISRGGRPPVGAAAAEEASASPTPNGASPDGAGE